MSPIHRTNSGQLLTIAVTFAAALAQGQSQTQLAELGAFFTIVGDTLALYSLGPDQSNTAASGPRRTAETEQAAASVLSLEETL